MRYIVLTFFILAIILFTGCITDPIKPKIVYVCSDTKTVDDPRDCVPEKASADNVVERPCNCNCACGLNQSDEIIPVQPAGNISSPCVDGAPYVGSLSTKTFHLASCSHAKRITEENRVCFATKEEALAAGYVPCKTCLK